MNGQFIDLDVSPSRAASVLELQDLRLVKLTWEMLSGSVVPPYSFDLVPKLGYSHQDELVVFEVAYHFDVSSQDDGTRTVLEGDVAYQVAYHLPDSVQLDGMDLSAFGNSTVLLAVHPFLRELLHGLTTRSGLPPLVLPLLRTHINLPMPQKMEPGRSDNTTKTAKAKTEKPPAKRAATRNTSTKQPSAKQQ
ncbi:MAG: hypothetical protein ACYDGY_09705 [Acidimicrobiales bacterium]